jgi:glycosyltransferase involved in cell wall biosynthesis
VSSEYSVWPLADLWSESLNGGGIRRIRSEVLSIFCMMDRLSPHVLLTGMKTQKKILQIGNYPPPMCGWAIQTKLVTDELRRRGHICQVLKINENRQIKDPAYIDVQGGFDYLFKVLRYAAAGYRLNVHVNGQSKPGFILALIATLAGRLMLHPALVTFHGGLSQAYFPRTDSTRLRLAFGLLFHLAGGIACDDEFVRQAIIDYGIRPEKVAAIETFSPQYLRFQPVSLPQEMGGFLNSHSLVFFCYVSFRPEYNLSMLRDAMNRFRQQEPRSGFVWLGFPDKELPLAQEFVRNWPADERQSLLLLGNLDHATFLTLLSRCFACIRTPACDGVAASVLESLAMGIPVIASENGRRPAGTLTYHETDAADLFAKLVFLVENSSDTKAGLQYRSQERSHEQDNVARMADWLEGKSDSGTKPGVTPATEPS